MEKIPALKDGRQYRFSKDVVDNWLKDKIITRKKILSQQDNKENASATAGKDK